MSTPVYNSMKRNGAVPCRWIDLLDDEISNQIAVAGAASVVWGKTFTPPKNCSFGMILKFTSSGTVNVKVELESGLLVPTTEGATDTNYGVGDTVGIVTATTTQVLVPSPVVSPYLRLKLSGLAGNDASTILTKCAFTFEKNL